MPTRRTLAAAVIGVLPLAAPATGQPKPLNDLLRLGAEYVAGYVSRVSGAQLDEEHQLREVTTGRVMGIQRLSSDIVLVDLNGRVVALRDAFAIDSKPIRDRQPRIVTMLAELTRAAWERVQDTLRDTDRHFHVDLIARVNDPTLALRFIAADLQPRFKYKVGGKKRLKGVEVVGVEFEEIGDRETKWVLETLGNARATGRIWMDPASGTIHQTELWLEGASETARINVTYAHDGGLDLWLPASMSDTYEIREGFAGPSDLGAAATGTSARASFECKATYTNARLTPIDLKKVR